MAVESVIAPWVGELIGGILGLIVGVILLLVFLHFFVVRPTMKEAEAQMRATIAGAEASAKWQRECLDREVERSLRWERERQEANEASKADEMTPEKPKPEKKDVRIIPGPEPLTHFERSEDKFEQHLDRKHAGDPYEQD